MSAEVTGIPVADITFPGGDLACSGIGPFHIHQAPAGANGLPVIVFSDAGFFTDTATGLSIEVNDLAFDDWLLFALLSGDLYLNLHTLDYGSGEIRGQLSAVPLPLVLLVGPLALVAGFFRRAV